jgi:hypothetical protein
MQLPPRDSNDHVPVRRLWPGSRWEEKAEAGTIVRVPSGIAVRMVLAGDAMPVFVDDPDAPPSGTLVAAIRAALRGRRRALRAVDRGARLCVPRCRPGSGAAAGGRTPAPDHRRFAAGAMPRLQPPRGLIPWCTRANALARTPAIVCPSLVSAE